MAAGQFFFAYVNAGVAFNSSIHNVEDEDVFAFRYVQEEADFAEVEFDIKNPRVGLLNSGRKQWAWFSYDTGVAIVPLFYGRIVGVPSNIFEEIVTVTYTARPVDYAEQKDDLADSMRVAPFWDPLAVAADKQDEPDVVLEGYSKLWHIDPVTHVLTASDVINGEDGTVVLQANDYFHEGMSLTLNTSPATQVRLKVTVPWDNYAQSSQAIDVTNAFMQFFANMHVVESFTLKGLQSSWPKPLTNIQGGYITTEDTRLEDISFLAYPQLVLPDYFKDEELPAPLPVGSLVFEPRITGHWTSGPTADFDIQAEVVYAAKGYGKPIFKVHWQASREYSEVLSIVLRTSTQPIVTAPGDDEFIEIAINCNKASDFVGAEIPIGDPKRTKFFLQPRGKDLVKHLLCIARAALIIKSRAVEIVIEMAFPDYLAAAVTLRKNLLIFNARLPGGQAAGKVIGVAFELDGDSGAITAKIKMACAIGRGGAYTAEEGDPVYCSTDYTGNDYQQFTDVVDLIDPSIDDLKFTVTNYVPNDDGVDLANIRDWRDIISAAGPVINTAPLQLAVLEPLTRGIGDTQTLTNLLNDMPTQITLEFINLNAGPFETAVTVVVEDLLIPAQINLEAAGIQYLEASFGFGFGVSASAVDLPS